MSDEIESLKIRAEWAITLGICLCGFPDRSPGGCPSCGGMEWDEIRPEFALKLAVKALRADEAEKRAETAEGLLRDMASDGLPVADVCKLQAALKTLAAAVGLLMGDISSKHINTIIEKALADAEIVTTSSGAVLPTTITAWNASLAGTPPAAG